jgi:hypothetical protein
VSTKLLCVVRPCLWPLTLQQNAGTALFKRALYRCELAEHDPEKCPNAFEVITVSPETGKSDTVLLCAESEFEMHMWLNSLVAHKVYITEYIDSITVSIG